MRRMLPLFSCLIPGVAAANGGPVAWTSATGAGNLAPVNGTAVALVSERLGIVFEDDGAHYRVRAEYVLSNPAEAAATVNYGVPLFWYPPDLGEFDGPEDPAERKLLGEKERAYPGNVRIAVAGRKFPCNLQDVHRVQDKEGGHIAAWCVAAIDVPRGERVPLMLEYRASFRFTDYAFTKSPFTVHHARMLFYDLSPAGSWAGRPKTVDVTIEPGLWKGFFHPTHPQGFVEQGPRLELHLVDGDLTAMGAIEGTLDAAKVLDHRERAGMKPDPRFRASASSERPRQGASSYAARNVLDGNPATAWCAARNRTAVGQWIEIHATDIVLPAYCRVQGYVLVPGYTRNQDTWTRNNRIRAVRLRACGAAGGGKSESVAAADRFDTSAADLGPLPDDAINAAIESERSNTRAPTAEDKIRVGEYCVRLTIEGIEEGADHDTCISEFRPVINCG